ncbi:MAG: N-carbamoyl-L-amino acid hydrolase [uncultured Rubrobacteraceae bacterium]|uniref:N-carbamoyl-L-amino acid hydrolase n=1 Tax=uncultured Rubrobacteraceae bacterium TaxID=349277 RepID=A0A6J4Q7H3_9ACTN|nr:MAG: N-carbamoyl-L-amino acid hydrolase [uncultured Rubrobacteraceae bacterium]
MPDSPAGIDQERLWSRLSELSKIGKSEGAGVTRLSFTREERAAKDLVASYMREAGLEVREDAIGNLIGRREGRDRDAPIVLAGSHVDSVRNGGDFDGPLGVLGAVEALHTMSERELETERPLEVVAFTDEEGARFSSGMIGSRALAGTLKPEDLQAKDRDGVSIAEAMRACGLDPERIGEAARAAGSVHSYVELHIEQGGILESRALPVGIVTGIAGPAWLRLTLTGEAAHAGTTPMGLRRDALAAAAAVMGRIEREAMRTGTSVGTVGQLELSPGGINIVPGHVSFSLDLRDIDEDIRNDVEARIMHEAMLLCEKRGVSLGTKTLQRLPPAPCSKLVQEAARAACREQGFEPFELASGAGHDGMHLTELCPIGMIFVRSKRGISHNPAEYSSKEDCAAGAAVLYRTLLGLAREI